MSTASNNVGVERIKLSDGTALKLETLIVDVRESGFPPFDDVYFDVKVVGEIAVERVPEEVKKLAQISHQLLQNHRLVARLLYY